jgi:hypothetical protein
VNLAEVVTGAWKCSEWRSVRARRPVCSR